MAFLELSSAPHNSVQEASLLQSLRTISLLRVGVGLILLIYYAIPAAVNGYHFVWTGKPWDWVSIVQAAGLPAPHLLAPLAGGVAISTALSWLFGFFTRLFSILALPVILGAVYVVENTGAIAHEPFVYSLFFVTLTLIMYGSGKISLDSLFRFAERPRKKKPRSLLQGP